MLAEVESQQVRSMQLDLLQESETVRWMRGEVERLRPLAEAGKLSTREFLSRTLELKTRLQTVAGLERRLSLIGLDSSVIGQLRTGEWSVDLETRPVSGRIAIRSSISGRVAGMGLKFGQLVHAHDSLFEIHNTNRIWIKALVLANDADRIVVGQQAVATHSPIGGNSPCRCCSRPFSAALSTTRGPAVFSPREVFTASPLFSLYYH